MSIWVVNTSPLIFLGNLGRLELLRHETREVYIPRAVAEEIAEKPDAAAQAVQAACAIWIQVRNVTDYTIVVVTRAKRPSLSAVSAPLMWARGPLVGVVSRLL
jgi:predicted nucleic acid-binding protein